MKKFLIFTGTIVLLLIAVIVIVPILFKDDIKNAIDESIDESLNATVFYDVDKFDISLIKSFPDFSVSLGDFGIVGAEEFEKDTLVSVQSFEVTIDLMSVISGKQITINKILLDGPKISLLILENGKANYDITQANEDEETPIETEGEASEFDVSIGIKKWTIVEGTLSYSDKSLGFYTELVGLNHQGFGDFTLDIFDLTTKTKIENVSLWYDGVAYASDKRVEAEVALNMNLPEMKFEFKDNRVAINDFEVGVEGTIAMPEEDIQLDLLFGGKDITIKSILSLIPGVYQEYLNGVSASGLVHFGGIVKGTYNENAMPQIGANLSVEDGVIRYSEFDIPMEQINIETSFDYPSADLSETRFNVDKLSLLVDGESLEAYLNFKDFENYTWDFGFEGNADLEKITKIVPLEDMVLKGKINAVLNSAGTMALLEAERYQELSTSGKMTINNFYFQSPNLTQGFGISNANMTFNPKTIELVQFDATSGNSDFSLKGKVENFIGFTLSDQEVLNGTLFLNSKRLDVDGFIPDNTEDEEVVEDTTTLEVIKIPENIDFVFNSSIEQITAMGLEMSNFQGKVTVRDGAIVLDKNSFGILDGIFEMTGSYVTKNLDQPSYDLGFKVKNLSIASAYESFTTVQKYVPIAKQVAGNFSIEFNVNGLLGSDMMPLMDGINMDGLVNVIGATLNSGSFMSSLNALTALKSGGKGKNLSKQISLRDVLIEVAIKEGRLFVQPFSLNVHGQEATLGGSNTLDGKLDYSLLVKEISTGAIGSTLNGMISSFTGNSNLISDKMDVDIGIGGTFDDIKLSLLSASPTSSSGVSSASVANKQQMSAKLADGKAKAEAELAKKKAQVEAKLAKERAAAEEKVKTEVAKVKAAFEAQKKAKQDSIKAAKKKLEQDAKKKIKRLFKKSGGN